MVAIYGGFFGAGMGILTLAALSIQGFEDIQEINALKNLTSGVNYTVSCVHLHHRRRHQLAAYHW